MKTLFFVNAKLASTSACPSCKRHPPGVRSVPEEIRPPPRSHGQSAASAVSTSDDSLETRVLLLFPCPEASQPPPICSRGLKRRGLLDSSAASQSESSPPGEARCQVKAHVPASHAARPAPARCKRGASATRLRGTCSLHRTPQGQRCDSAAFRKSQPRRFEQHAQRSSTHPARMDALFEAKTKAVSRALKTTCRCTLTVAYPSNVESHATLLADMGSCEGVGSTVDE